MKNNTKYKVDYLKLKECLNYFCEIKSSLLTLNIENSHLIEILKSLNRKFNLEEISKSNINQLRINIDFNKNGINHYLGFANEHFEYENIKFITIKKLINNPEKEISKLFKNASKLNIKTVLNKIKSFIKIISDIKDNNSKNFLFFYSITFKNYNGCFCIRNDKYTFVLNVNTTKENNDHIFLHCHIRSLRSDNCKKYLKNQIIFSNLTIRKTNH